MLVGLLDAGSWSVITNPTSTPLDGGDEDVVEAVLAELGDGVIDRTSGRIVRGAGIITSATGVVGSFAAALGSTAPSRTKSALVIGPGIVAPPGQ